MSLYIFRLLFFLLLLSITHSYGENLFFVTVDYFDSEFNEYKAARVYLEILDRLDGSYVVRYKLYKSYKKLRISVFSDTHEHIAQSPYNLDATPINQDKCNCPEQNFRRWLLKMQCNETYTQIELDMKRVEENMRTNLIDMDQMRQQIIDSYNQEYTHSFCNYVILNNEVDHFFVTFLFFFTFVENNFEIEIKKTITQYK